LLVLTACITNHVGFGVILPPDWQTPRRDPDPTIDFTKEQTTNVWVPGDEAKQTATNPGDRRTELAIRIAALAAILLGGFMPMLVWSGTFDENRIAPKRKADQSSR
jgi:hypothetical protein